MSWLAVLISMPSFNKFKHRNRKLGYLSVFQSCLLFVFPIALLIKWDTFGSSPECNSEAVVVVFRSFSAFHAGRVIGWIAVFVALGFYTYMTIRDYRMMKKVCQRKDVSVVGGSDVERQTTTAHPPSKETEAIRKKVSGSFLAGVFCADDPSVYQGRVRPQKCRFWVFTSADHCHFVSLVARCREHGTLNQAEPFRGWCCTISMDVWAGCALLASILRTRLTFFVLR